MKILYNKSAVVRRETLIGSISLWEPKFKDTDFVWVWYERADISLGESLLKHTMHTILVWEEEGFI